MERNFFLSKHGHDLLVRKFYSVQKMYRSGRLDRNQQEGRYSRPSEGNLRRKAHGGPNTAKK